MAAASEGIGFAYVVIGCILLILFVVAATFAAYYYDQALKCSIYPNIWCWDDWSCCAEGATGPSGITGTDGLCWQGTTSLYGMLTVCSAVQGDSSYPPGCTCAWADVLDVVPNGCNVPTF
jgi:hypothetical protein